MFASEDVTLSISGKSVTLKPQYPPHLETRRIYNATFFRDEEYRHEIANHYRDFKRRPRIRRRRRNIFVRYRKTPSAIPISTDPYEYRDELPMTVHNFPRFALVYTPPRGRQCQCESQPPDETYNDSVRRIRAAKTCEELRVIVQRYSGYIAKREKHYRQHKGRQEKYEKSETQQSFPGESESDSKQQAATRQQKQQEQIRRRRSLGNLKSVAKASGKQKPPHSSACSDCDKTTTTTTTNTTATTSTIASTELYLQLANEHYEREYLANVKYLESIPERNALKRTRGNGNINSKNNNNNIESNDDTQSATLSASWENNWNYSRLASAKSNASNSSTNTDEPTPRRTCELNFGIANLLRLIGRKRSFRIGSNDSTEYETVCRKIKNWAIRVDITPAAGELAASASTATAIEKTHSHSREQCNTVSADSMHDFLNANTGKAIQILETTTFNNNNFVNNNNSINGLVSSGEWSTEHLHSIIDNLTQLDLNALNSRVTAGLIPRITLTNYCDFTKNQFYEGQGQIDFDNSDSQVLKSAPSACNSALLLRPTKFICKENLDIPSEIDYQSEARPP